MERSLAILKDILEKLVKEYGENKVEVFIFTNSHKILTDWQDSIEK